MSEITLCIITKGRKRYLAPLLESLDKALLHEHVQVLIILNGVSFEIERDWKNWELTHPARVEILIYPVNEPGISRFWPIIRKINTKWIAFPSDDDVLSDVIFEEWMAFENEFGNFGAIATPLRLIDPFGSSLGIVREPEFLPTLSPVQSVAKSLSECPFLWPGLILNVKKLPKTIPHSRYVSDWWLGLYMMLTSSVTIASRPFVQYRVHEGQESAISSLSRKNYEALIHIGELITSSVFANWIMERDEAEVLEFLCSISKFPPINGDTKCGSELVSIITSTVYSLRGEEVIQLLALRINAFVHDVLVDNSQLEFLGSTSQISKSEGVELNFWAEIDHNVCSKIDFVKVKTTSYNISEYPSVRIGCLHSRKRQLDVRIDCASQMEPDEIMSLLLYKATEYLQSVDTFRSEVSLFEYSLIMKLRAVKARIPKFLRRFLYYSVRKK